ncbi:sialoadhesin isoform X1 [Carassius gibelio]|uniref:sialoadhesin isoform X1 n=1 Tax=Carassius gibelio TaxID=101364 RepID=UPI0022781646|nr:sialoadhesin isoform X1 [Carassius gibelio]XP_052390048.1 sialoadhesin isoform X1 [Carassius gibelio]
MSGLKVLVVIIWMLRECALCVLIYAGAASNKWEIKMPKKIDAISGLCVQIPCQFEIPDSFKQSLNNLVEGIWKKISAEGPNVLSSKTTVSLLKGNVIGNISDKNCTTVFYSFPDGFSETFFFRLQGPEPLLYTFQQGINITVHKDVPPPILSPYVQVMEVLEGTRLTLTCSTVISCPSVQPQLQWNPQLGEKLTPALQEDEFGQTLLASSQMFNVTPLNDQLKISCSVLYYQGAKRPAETSITLRVLYAPRNTIALVSPSDPVYEGSMVVLSCHSDANPAVQRYEWYKDSGSGKLELQNQGQTLTLIAKSTVQGLYVCRVHNIHGTDRSRPVAVGINSCQCSIALYTICGLLTLFLILITAVDLVKYKSLLNRLEVSESLRGPMTYSTLHGTSDTVYNVIQTRASRSEDDYENRNLGKPHPK